MTKRDELNEIMTACYGAQMKPSRTDDLLAMLIRLRLDEIEPEPTPAPAKRKRGRPSKTSK